MTVHTRLVLTSRDRFLEPVEKEMIQFEQREIEFRKKIARSERQNYIYPSSSQKFDSIREAVSVGARFRQPQSLAARRRG